MSEKKVVKIQAWVLDLALIAILLIGGYFRLTGVRWDQGTHLHPDERFLTMVETSLAPVKNLGEYFNTAQSTLNPNNRGYNFFVYGTLPIFIVRYVAEWVGQASYDQVDLVGRQLSAIADLLTVFMVYLIGSRLYNRRVGVLAAAFSALAVLQIQLSHYFTVDTFTNFFTFLAFYFAVRIMDGLRQPEEIHKAALEEQTAGEGEAPGWRLQRGSITLFILFGVALGMAAASKINAAPLAIVLPIALIIRYSRSPREEWEGLLLPSLVYLGIAALVSLVTFRIFQPYAFSGPGFLGLSINPQWLNTMKELSAQSRGTVDFPPALQWTRRPIWFSLQNLVLWGMGLPLGLLAWAGFLWMGWRIFKGEWRQHGLIWVWTLVYFVWQSVGLTRTMRYQLLIYPTLAIIAAWAVIHLWDVGQQAIRKQARTIRMNGVWLKAGAAVVGGLVLIATFAWAYAFTRVYTRPLTRVAASQWIFENVPGPINLQVQTSNGKVSYPLAYQQGVTLASNEPFIIAFQPMADSQLSVVDMPHLVDASGNQGMKNLRLTVSDTPGFERQLTSTLLSANFVSDSNDPRGKEYPLAFDQPAALKKDATYYLKFELQEPDSSLVMYGPPRLTLVDSTGIIYQPLPQAEQILQAGKDFTTQFVANWNGTLQQVLLDHVVDRMAEPEKKTLQLTITGSTENGQITSTGTVVDPFTPETSVDTSPVNGTKGDPRGRSYVVTLDQPLQVVKGATYVLSVSVTGKGEIALYGSSTALESDWDDALPQPMPGYGSAYDYFTGLYQNDLNFQMYWSDDPKDYSSPSEDKLTRFLTTLSQSDYIFISSNRQWGSTVRVPERYPLTTAYYRNLIGCPDNKDILWCYSVAEPGMFQGKLGFDLVSVFQSDPNLGSLRINDQFAEEAFTVYDHPKVLIFKKNAAYNQQAVSSLLGSVDLTHIQHILPDGSLASGSTSSPDGRDTMLSAAQWAADQVSGTWSVLFKRADLLNRSPVLGLIAWYLAVALLGLLAYPLVRLALPGLSDRGYPLARTAGLLVLAYLFWIAGSLNLSTSRLMISLMVLLMALVSAFLAYRQREELKVEWQQKKKYFLAVELVALGFFALDLLIRLGNPDLWHQYKGGEKPMDFSYLNAVIKSESFPAYNPWFSGGYINYYYYGFVIVGVLIKWLGIVPSVAYNLVLPTLFSMLALGAFSIGWNLMKGERRIDSEDHPGTARRGFFNRLFEPFSWPAFRIGLAAVLAVLILGNLGTVRMIWQGFQRLAAPGGNIDNVSVLQHWIWAIQGVPKYLSGDRFHFYPGDWYWIPSRAIPGEPITEFPFFTFLYADLHAHMIALPVTVLALSWALSFLLSCGRWGEPGGRHAWMSAIAGFGLGGVVIGALWPTNTWDFPTYLALACVAVVYSLAKYARPLGGWFQRVPGSIQKAGLILVSLGLLVGLSRLLYQPYFSWYVQGYNAVDPWKGSHTPFWSYLTHWGLFLFVIVSWLIWETRSWMAATPVSALRKLEPYRWLIEGGAVVVLAGVIALLYLKVIIGWLVLPLIVWAGILLLRPNQPDTKRAVLFMIGTGLVLTLAVELVVLRGDVGRMNTVFKFYMQAWILLALSSAAALGWLVREVGRLPQWSPRLQTAWQFSLTVLVFGAALFPVMGGLDKIRDRMAAQAPHTLDGMAYMEYAQYAEKDTNMDLSQDYQAILWMQEHVDGSPVIVEGHTLEYHWGNRFTIYTGLPSVVGWRWHQIQQHPTLPSELVDSRINDVESFYTTTDTQTAIDFLRKYNVRYIIVGQLEKILYPGSGMDKFSALNGQFWKEVYRQGDTAIYEVSTKLASVSPDSVR